MISYLNTQIYLPHLHIFRNQLNRFPILSQFSFPDKAMGEERFQMGF